jgi:hypothetical protein
VENFEIKDGVLEKYLGREETVTIPNDVTSIGSFAFKNCDSIKEITIPESVTSIGTGAFWCCEELTKVSLPQNLSRIYPMAFWGCVKLNDVVLPDSVRRVGYAAFKNCTSLKSIKLSDLLVAIETSTFENCTSLKEIDIPQRVEIIFPYAFLECKNLKNVQIHDGLKGIGLYAFGNCIRLTQFTLEASIEEIEEAFKGCDNLALLNINGFNEKNPINGHYKPAYGMGEWYINIIFPNITAIILGDSITNIPNGILQAKNLRYVKFSKNVTTIEEQEPVYGDFDVYYEGECDSFCDLADRFPNLMSHIDNVFCSDRIVRHFWGLYSDRDDITTVLLP